MGYVDKKVVADLGCGHAYGATTMSYYASIVYAVDNGVMSLPHQRQIAGDSTVLLVTSLPTGIPKNTIVLQDMNIFDFKKKVDVCVAVEVFEHMKDPSKFIEHMSMLSEYVFITTPLALYTCRSPNEGHVAEYCKEDFIQIIESKFEILKMVYQLGDMSIVDHAAPAGTSISRDHVVQMAWCKRK